REFFTHADSHAGGRGIAPLPFVEVKRRSEQRPQGKSPQTGRLFPVNQSLFNGGSGGDFLGSEPKSWRVKKQKGNISHGPELYGPWMQKMRKSHAMVWLFHISGRVSLRFPDLSPPVFLRIFFPKTLSRQIDKKIKLWYTILNMSKKGGKCHAAVFSRAGGQPCAFGATG
ncbi:MAG: hypothetical protein SOT42_05630, partial [Eubacteriales bacterium]|nr:hypothetical protein [Eubacteriales bacterium]